MPNYGGYAGKNSGGSNYGGKGRGNSGPRGGGNRKNTRGSSGEGTTSMVWIAVAIFGLPFMLFLASVGYVIAS